jgi:general secretion pathway protein D
MARRRPALRAWLVGAGIAIGGALLGGCNITSFGESGQAEPDATDRVRATDLQPRFPRPAEGADTGSSTGPRSSSFFGSGTALAPTAAREPTPGSAGEGYDFNFENTPVTTVAKVILGDILGTGYTIDPRVQGTVTLTSGHPVPKNDVLFVLESALRTSNVALVRERTGYRLVPAPEAIGSAGADRSPEAGYGVTVIPLRYVSVQTVTKLLDSFAAKPGAIKADTARNLVLVQGTGAERRAALDTVLSFDGDWMRGQSVGIYPIHNTTPEPVLAELEKIVDSGEGGLNQNLVKFQPVARMNAILVVTSKPELLRTVATWINRLDNSDTASTGVKVYRVRYGDARQIARLLNDIFLGGGAGGSLDSAASQLAPGAGASGMSTFDRLTGATQSTATTPGGLPQPQQPTMAGGLGGGGGIGGQPAASAATGPLGAGSSARTGGAPAAGVDTNSLLAGRAGGAPGAGAVLSGVRITADVVNNALLIYSNQENYRVIERAINQLDRPQLQVAIDLTIAEVTLNDNLNYGVQFFLTSANVGAPTGSGQAINTAVTQPLAQVFPGANLLIGKLANPQLIINALHTYTDVKVLSNPSLVVLDNQVATLQVGDQVPITTGTATVLSANNAVVNTINYQNTGIILRVVPRINSNGKVTLDIEQEISNVSPNSATGSLTPTISQRRVKSSISVVTGQTVLLAGLISETQNRTRSGIPFLDQIPGIGDAAVTNNQKGLMRTELIIFIRPQIIRDSVDAAVVAEELRSRLRGGKVGHFEPPGAAETPTPQVVR